MKNLTKNLAFLLIAFLTVLGCRDPLETWPYKCRVYPCPSNFTSQIDGQSWSAEGFRRCEKAGANVYYVNGDSLAERRYLSVMGTDCMDSIGIGFAIKGVYGEGVFNLLDEGSFAHFLNFGSNSLDSEQWHVVDSIIAGEVVIDLYMMKNYDGPESNFGRVQGSFWVDLWDKYTGDTIKIRNAEFDIKLP